MITQLDGLIRTGFEIVMSKKQTTLEQKVLSGRRGIPRAVHWHEKRIGEYFIVDNRAQTHLK